MIFYKLVYKIRQQSWKPKYAIKRNLGSSFIDALLDVLIICAGFNGVEAFTELLENNIGNAKELFDKVAEKNPQKALELLLKLSEFALPKLRAIEVDNESEEAMHTSLDIRIIDTGVPLASYEDDVIDWF